MLIDSFESAAIAQGTPFSEDRRVEAIEQLLATLEAADYRFVPPTPASHARVISRPDRQLAIDLPGVFGWSLPFREKLLGPRLFAALREAALIAPASDGLFKSSIRVARLHDKLFVHSAYPTTDVNSVFLGPDSYRFADFILANIPDLTPGMRIVDYGTGAGVGGIVSGTALTGAQLVLADINPDALVLAGINARHAGLDAETVKVRQPGDLAGRFDLFTTHPPFMIDEDHRAYRDGGGLHGAQLSRDWVIAGAAKLSAGGVLIMHTGAPIVAGRDELREALERGLDGREFALDYRELDPDIFGDELDKPAYAEVERIAAVGAVVRRIA